MKKEFFMEKIFKKINFCMITIALISIVMFFVPFLKMGEMEETMRQYILGRVLVESNYLVLALLICPIIIIILHLLEKLDNKVSHQDLIWSLGMIITSFLIVLIEKPMAVLIGFYIYNGCALIMFLVSLIRFFVFKRIRNRMGEFSFAFRHF